ncbi:MAG: phosphoribosyl-ATP diphosphatase [Proteobacteria bacterium]|nr:phosphoribosyl-ATP diphosphatase [Pseudomonadota bacterium]
MSKHILEQLDEVVAERSKQEPDVSYVASLFDKGLEKIQKKVNEESLEAILAAETDDRQALVSEVADLWFHSIVLLAYKNASVGDVVSELERRFGVSGIEEKASRTK